MVVTLRLLVLLLTFMTVASGQVAPTFTTQPISQAGAIGGNVTFTVAASGTAPLAYQWYKDGIAVAGATGSSLTISSVKLSDGGSYQASVTNAANRIRAVSAGREHTQYLKADGTLWAVGSNRYGGLGDGTSGHDNLRLKPVQVAEGVASVSAGGYNTLYVKTDGTLWVMGDNRYGQLGDDTTTQRDTPIKVATGVASVSAGGNHTLFVKTDGTLWAMGNNERGQLGNGTTTSSSTPMQVASGVASVSAGDNHTLFVKTGGTLWAMGANSDGMLGLGDDRSSRSMPVQVATGVASVSAGPSQTLFVKTDGTLWATGYNGSGQFGDGTTTRRSTPVQVATGVASVATGGGYHTMFVKTDGTLWAAGSNGSGQLGDGTITNSTTAVQVATGVAGVAAGSLHTLYVKTDGTLWVMGDNRYGQLGDGTTINRNTPVRIAAGLLSNVATLTLLPTITTQLNSSSVATGGVARFSVVATGAAPLTYQWMKDGTSISGATSSTYTIASTKTTDAGSYTVTVTNSAGSVTSNPATLTVTAPNLANLSVRTALEANQIVIVGFTMSGGAKNVLLRAAGPTLSAFGVPSAMADPSLDLYSGPTKVTGNNNWGGSSNLAAVFQSVGSFPYSATTSLDSALVASIDGGRTAHVSGPTAGVVLVEAYDAGSGSAQKFTSLSARNRVGTGADILIAGFTLVGEGSRNLLIRAVGPTLNAFGVTGTLFDPKMLVYKGSTIVAENDDWPNALAPTFFSAGAFALAVGSKDAALTVALPQGNYTVQISGALGGVGEALVEIYELP